MACTHGHASSILSSRQWLLRGDLVHMALRFDGPVVIHLSHGFNARHTPHAFPWSVWSALFCCYELVESSLLRDRDIQPRVGRWWAQRSSQTVVMASTDGRMSNDRRTPPRSLTPSPSLSSPSLTFLLSCAARACAVPDLGPPPLANKVSHQFLRAWGPPTTRA